MSHGKAFGLLACLLLAASADAANTTIFSTGSTWKYFKGRSEASSPVTAWRGVGFDDSSWASGPAPFYYGETLSGTLLSDMQGQYSCVFLRRNFQITDPAQIRAIKVETIIDDGVIAWINGTEVFRYNMPAGEIAYTGLASTAIEYETHSVVLTNISSLLVAGNNVIAIQAFNSSLGGSSDLVIDGALYSTSDTQPPTIVQVDPAPATTVSNLTQITVHFSEPVTGVDGGDLLVNGLAARTSSGSGDTYTFTFPQPDYGTVQIAWASANEITDLALVPNAFNGNGPGATWQYQLVDMAAPTIVNLFPPAGAVVRSLGQVEVSFSEDVVGVDAADLVVNGVAATNVIKQGGGPFIFQFAPRPAGPVNFTWASNHGITDVAPQANAFAGTGWSYTVDPSATPGDLIINEILAANLSGLADEDGEPEGWIEIYNRGSNPVNLRGWSLSDDPEGPSLWVFPDVTLNAGGYLIVFASGKDRIAVGPTNRLHSNFTLSRSGEFVGLFSPESPRVLISGYDFPEQRNDFSYGYDTAGDLRYFSVPTPGAPNGTSTILSTTEGVHFSVERGFYSNAFDLYLSSPTVGAQIHYTRDGTDPSPTTGLAYGGPLRITNSALIRAVAFRPNFLPSRVSTHTYLFNQNATIRSLPVISIVTAQTNLTGPSGIIGISNVVQQADGTWLPAVVNGVTNGYHNPSKHGIAWERPVSLEFIRPVDNSGFQADCGLRVQGSDYQRPRTTPSSKFSFRVYFRGDYGQGRLNYDLFPRAPVQRFDQIVLRAGFNDPSNPFIRDEITRRLNQDEGEPASQGIFVNLFTNGVYAGYYNPCERVHEEMLQGRHGGSDDWDVVGPSFATGAGVPGVIDGDRADFGALVNYILQQDTTQTLVYQQIQRRLDLVNFVDYLLLNVYTAMGDWPANNWRAGRDRNGTNSIWRFYVWDGEWAMGIYGQPVTTNTFLASGPGPNDSGLASFNNSEIAKIYQRLRLNPEFRLLWADRIQKQFFNNGALMDSNVVDRFTEMQNELRLVIPNMDTGIPTSWVPARRAIVFSHFNLYGLMASSNAPVFNRHGGRVSRGFGLTMTNLTGTIYFTTNGADPRVQFTSAVAPSAQAYTGVVPLFQSTLIKARSLDGTNWSALEEATFQVDAIGVPVRITEINYNPIGGNAYEFIELKNISSAPVDMTAMNFDGVTFRFPDGYILPAGAVIVLVSDANPAAFSARYPGVPIAGTFGGQLSNGGERLALKNVNGDTLLSVDYHDDGLWPAAADGRGSSLEIVDLYGDPDDPLNWRAGSGSPGTIPVIPPPPGSVVINEISAASTPEWIELFNNTASSLDLAGYSLTDDSNARKFVFPSRFLGVSEHLVIYCDNNSVPGQIHSGFSLNPNGDQVLLYGPQTNLLSSVSFGAQISGYSLGRFSGAGTDPWLLSIPTAGSNNVTAAVGSQSSLVINEWLANPVAGADDWVELWNSSSQPIALKGMYLATSNNLFQITSRSFVAPFGFIQLVADENPGPDHLDFRLPATGGQLVLSDSTGTEVNRVVYGNQTEGVSQGRLPNGSSTIVSFVGTASPGASNYVISYTGPYINEVMARNVSAVTNSAGRVADWIEIFNPTASPFDLGGMRLSVDEADPAQWVIPASTVVAANGYLTIWCDGGLPASTAAEANLNTGRSLNGDSGAVYLFSAAGQLVNSVEYGFQIENRSIGRIAAQWRLMATATPGTANGTAATLGAVTSLVFNEWMANPAKGDDWFEIYNPASSPVDLSGLYLTDDPSIGGQATFKIPALSFAADKGFVRYEADGNASKGFDHVNFSLDGDGEALRLYNTVNGTNFVAIDSVYFGQQAQGVSQGRLPDGGTNIVSFPGSAGPGESNYLLPENVRINEVLAYGNSASDNAIELFNPGSASANIGGWYLSNDRANLKKYRVPDGTTVPAGSYSLLYESSFASAFTLNGVYGSQLFLSAADGSGNLTGVRVPVKYGPSAPTVSFGRYQSSQRVEFVSMASRTLGSANSAPKVGPVVINEIMYNPLPWPSSIPDADGEFIELANSSSTAVSLGGWHLDGGVQYTFPISASIPAGGYIIIANFDPNTNAPAVAEFRYRYSVSPSITILGPYRGKLDNAEDDVQLLQPGVVPAPPVPYILMDRVEYSDSNPWPSGLVDGGGLSLQRRNSSQFGNDPLNWLGSQPTAGYANGTGIVPLPVITTSPQSQTVSENAIVQLSVGASGGGTLSYQWRFNGLDLPGANEDHLVLPFVQLEHTGNYDVIVANAAGAAISPAATVFVVTAPLVVNPVPSQIVNTNANVTFSVGVRASAPVSYQWRLNGVNIAGATNSTYVRSNVQLEDSGEYSVLITNPAGSAIASGTLIVLVGPIFIQQPQNQTVVEGDNATFRVLVRGTQPFGYRWRRAGATFINFPASPVGVLTNALMAWNSNRIDCIVTNLANLSGIRSDQPFLIVLRDTDGDHLPDVWENANGFDMNNPADGAVDSDGDGMTNRQEYLAGTDPHDPLSYLRIDIVNPLTGGVPSSLLRFIAVSNKTYTVQYKNDLSTNGWTKLLDIDSRTTNRLMEVREFSPDISSRFYQLVTPQQ